ncbi:MAG TPA: TRAP transporter small permease [Pseudolabrys sp.]|nr:TRAP transporter small permease [Pseudolabrys sp.]
MVYGLDDVGTAREAASTRDAAGPFGRILAAVNSCLEVVCAVALVVAGLVLTYSVITRYFLHLSTDWQDEVSVFLIVGAVFMSAGAVQARRGHIGIEAIVVLLSPRANLVRSVLVDIVTLIFCAYFSWKSGLLLLEAIEGGFRTSSTWQPPLAIPYSLMTVGMALLTLQVLLQVIQQLTGRGRPT